jgi:hypothetical protein
MYFENSPAFRRNTLGLLAIAYRNGFEIGLRLCASSKNSHSPFARLARGDAITSSFRPVIKSYGTEFTFIVDRCVTLGSHAKPDPYAWLYSNFGALFDSISFRPASAYLEDPAL